MYSIVVTKFCPRVRWGEIIPLGGVLSGGGGEGSDPTSVAQLTN